MSGLHHRRYMNYIRWVEINFGLKFSKLGLYDYEIAVWNCIKFNVILIMTIIEKLIKRCTLKNNLCAAMIFYYLCNFRLFSLKAYNCKKNNEKKNICIFWNYEKFFNFNNICLVMSGFPKFLSIFIN